MLLRRVALFYIFTHIFDVRFIRRHLDSNICFFIQSCNIPSCCFWKTLLYTPEHMMVKRTNCILVL